MVVNLIMRSCRPRSFANQIGPRRSETTGRAVLSGTGHRVRQELLVRSRDGVLLRAGKACGAVAGRRCGKVPAVMRR